jgi:hypothetical protein
MTNYYLNRIRRVASRPELKSKLLFSIGDFSKNELKLKRIKGIDPESSKIVSIIESKGNTYVMSSEFSTEALESFVADFLSGSLTPADDSDESDIGEDEL